MSRCPDRATGWVRFEQTGQEYVFCNRHSWPWRVGRGNGMAETGWL